MKRIRIIELFAEIKANLVAFLSVSMFVGLGLALFLGIQWGAEALKNALEAVGPCRLYLADPTAIEAALDRVFGSSSGGGSA